MENGYHSFAENFDECLGQSCMRLAYEREQTDAGRIAASQECDALYQEIQKKLGKEHHLIDSFEEAKNHAQSLDEKWIYQQGFQDCVYLLRWIGLI